MKDTESESESEKENDAKSKHESNIPTNIKPPLTDTDDLEYKILYGEDIKCHLTFKIIILGNSGVGKSCLSLKATKNIFDSNYNRTIGFEFFDFNIRFENKENIKLQIWDTCGQEVYRSFISNFFHSASLAFIVYSINDKKSFDAIDEWLKELKEKSSPDIKIFLLGNKVDLEDERKVKYEEGENLKETFDFFYFNETSAKTGLNVNEVFVEAAKLLYNDYLKYEKIAGNKASLQKINDNSSIQLNKHKNLKKKKKGCC